MVKDGWTCKTNCQCIYHFILSYRWYNIYLIFLDNDVYSILTNGMCMVMTNGKILLKKIGYLITVKQDISFKQWPNVDGNLINLSVLACLVVTKCNKTLPITGPLFVKQMTVYSKLTFHMKIDQNQRKLHNLTILFLSKQIRSKCLYRNQQPEVTKLGT